MPRRSSAKALPGSFLGSCCSVMRCGLSTLNQAVCSFVRRLSRGQRSDGRNAGQVFGLGVAVRLRADRSHQRRIRRPISGRVYQGHGRVHAPPAAFLRRPTLPPGWPLSWLSYFWWKNTQGMHESSQKALQIMVITTVMVVILLIWCTITVLRAPIQLPPNPLHPGVIPLNKESLGWLKRNLFRTHHLDHPFRRLRALGAGNEPARRLWRRSTARSNIPS